MWRTFLAAVAMVACWACSAVAEKEDVEIGVLICTLGEPDEALVNNASSGRQTRDALCTFKPKNTSEEAYAGKVEGVSLSADQKGALIWMVKSSSGSAVRPGLLQQSYATDPKKPADQMPPMIGEANSDIAFHTMADKIEGSANATVKPAPTGFVILSAELKLKSASA